MAQALANYFVDDPAVVFRTNEETNDDANWQNGMNAGASNAPGIGISTENPGLEESLPNWTLLDQFGNAREAQISQCLGGPGFVDRSSVDWPSSGGQEGTLPDDVARFGGNQTQAAKDADPAVDGDVIPLSNCTLSVLADGWIESP